MTMQTLLADDVRALDGRRRRNVRQSTSASNTVGHLCYLTYCKNGIRQAL